MDEWRSIFSEGKKQYVQRSGRCPRDPNGGETYVLTAHFSM